MTGASGFIGSRLRSALISAGHRPIVAVRGREVPAGVDGIAWNPEDGTIDAQALDGVGGVVHLAAFAAVSVAVLGQGEYPPD